jgi:hypothetical protein
MIILLHNGNFLDHWISTKCLDIDIVLVDFLIPFYFEVVIALGLDDFTVIYGGA